MRYRPFARTGMAVSALSLRLNGDNDEREAADWRDLVHCAFEEGVNTFELVRPSAALMRGFGEGVAAVKRSLVFVALRLDPGLDGQGAIDWVDDALEATGLEEFNLVGVDLSETVEGSIVPAMRWMKDEGMAHRLAVAGPGDLLEEAVQLGHFDAVITPFNLLSGWRERHLVRTALESQLGVIACDPCPAALAAMVEEGKAQGKGGWFKKAPPLGGAGTYAFLAKTQGWNVEQICVGYALTEPAVATVQVETIGRQHLHGLADVADRGLPSAVSAQIEMARFSAEREAQARRRA
jgi:aryl-alcohol dehydrogenase-like predicted oxidoreductase